MGRHQPNKPRRPRGRDDEPPTEWYGTGFHSTEGMYHLDVRPSGNSILITSSPAEVDGAPATWALRLRNDDDGQGLDALGAALEAGQPHGIPVEAGQGSEKALVFIPDHPGAGTGTLARVRSTTGSEGDFTFERCAERPMDLWAEAGQNLRRIVPFLGPGSPPADEEYRMCPGCHRPVYESSDSHTVLGADRLPVLGLCRLCADGSTLRSLRQSGAPVPPQQLAILETVAAALA